MITGDLKNKVDKLWEMFWTGGLTNPLDVIEQITYLMFIRDLDQTDNTRQKESVMLGIPYTSMFEDKENLKWSTLRDKPAETDALGWQLYRALHGAAGGDVRLCTCVTRGMATIDPDTAQPVGRATYEMRLVMAGAEED